MSGKIIELKKDVYWIGGGSQQGSLHCNPYLIIDGEEGILIDPGSVLDFEEVYDNLISIIPLEKINYCILHHQDPDFCSSVPLFEKAGANFKIVTHWRAKELIQFYGVKSDYYLINENNYSLSLKSGRMLEFIPTPYLHFPGAFVTYDRVNKMLFSSDIFGALSGNWTLFADDDYIEKMKTFHEHYMPSNDILRSVMEIFLKMDIEIIAPQHGSIINNKIKEHIKVLRDLECGSMLTPLKKNLSKAGGYSYLISIILKRLSNIFSKKEVMKIVEDLDITIDTDLNISDYNYTGKVLWNTIFNRIMSIHGSHWITIVEPLVKTLSREYEILMPDIYMNSKESTLEYINNQNENLKGDNEKLRNSLKEVETFMTKCSALNIYNYDFFRNYISREISRIIEEGSTQNPGLMVISLDNMTSISYSHGELAIDRIMEIAADLIIEELNEKKEFGDVLFKLHGASFGCYMPMVNRKSVLELAERIRSKIEESNEFIEKITVSIGIVDLAEVRLNGEYYENLDELFYSTAITRVNRAKKTGMNTICYVSDIDDHNNKNMEILLVDTDEVNLDILKTSLENLDYVVHVAKDGEEALMMVEKNNISLIVSEIMIPKIDGLFVREKLLTKERTKKIPYLITSHLKNDDSVKRAISLGINNYFKKPFMLSEILGVISNKLKGEF